MDRKIKVTMYIVLFALSAYMVTNLINIQFKAYKYYNDTTVNKYELEIISIKQKLDRNIKYIEYVLENPFYTNVDRRSEIITATGYGTFTTNDIIKKIPKTLTGNYFVIKSYGESTTLKKQFNLPTYLDDLFKMLLRTYTISSQNYINKNNINSLNLLIYDFYIYKYPYVEFVGSKNIYEEEIKRHGEDYIKKLNSIDTFIVKPLHLDIYNKYVFTVGKSIEYFNEPIGFLSVDFNHYALANDKNNRFNSYVFTNSGNLLTSTDEYFLSASSNKEFENFLKSDLLEAIKKNIKNKGREVYYKNGNLLFSNYILGDTVVVVNSIEIGNLLIILITSLVPVLIVAFLINKIILSLSNSKKINKEVRKVINELKLKNSKIEIASKEDHLTNLLNKSEISKLISEEIVNFKSYNPFSIAICDIDDMKCINKKYGYISGDIAIKGVTSIIKNTIRDYDEVAMWNGPQILIIFKNDSGVEAVRICNEIKRKIEVEDFKLDKVTYNITASFGISKFEYGITKDELISRAESSLEEAKAINKNEIVVYKK